MNRAKSRGEQRTACCCAELPESAVVPIGGEGLDERVFATLEQICDHGGEQWWLYLSKCKACGQKWMVAQEERIFDDYFLRRLDEQTALRIIAEGLWPADFLTYEAVLKMGRKMSGPFTFVDELSPSLVWTVQDLRKERPGITTEEIAYLLGVTPAHARRLLRA
jgi:hypothetical protein